jgi:protein gp37
MRSWTENMPDNVWMGTTVENQEMANERIPHLLKIPAKVRFLSVEPMLEAIDLDQAARKPNGTRTPNWGLDIHWVICGGESGGEARPFQLEWARSLRKQCEAAEVAFFMKQMGSNPHMVTSNPAHMSGTALNEGATAELIQINFKHRKGEDPAEWLADLQIQEFPKGCG